MATNLSRLPGILEGDIAAGSGLCLRQFTAHLVSNLTNNVNAQPIGGAASANVTTWTDVALNNRTNSYAGTLVARVAQASLTTGTVQLRVRGYDQFHEYIEEITPVVNLVAKTNNNICLAKCFSQVIQVSFKSTGIDIAGDTLSVGQQWDWTRTEDATNEWHGDRNLGIGIPLRLGRHLLGVTPGSTFRVPQADGVQSAIINVQDASIQLRVRSPNNAYSTLSITAAANNDTVTIDGQVYTFKAALTPAPYEVAIGGTTIDSATNLRAAIIAAPNLVGTSYGAGTVAHTTVTLGPVQTDSTVSTVQVMAKRPGALGNIIAISEAGANLAFSPTGFLAGGTDAPVEVLGLVVEDVTGSAAAGAITNLTPAMFAVGHSEVGWTGSVEKLHILKQTDVAQWATTDHVLVAMTVLSAESKP